VAWAFPTGSTATNASTEHTTNRAPRKPRISGQLSQVTNGRRCGEVESGRRALTFEQRAARRGSAVGSRRQVDLDRFLREEVDREPAGHWWCRPA